MAPSEIPVPDVLAMVLADNVHQDPSTGKCFVLGTFTVVHADSMPYTLSALAVYISCTDGRGMTPLVIRLVDSNEEDTPLFEIDVLIDFTDPISVYEVAAVKCNVVFPTPGEYRVQLLCGGKFVRERRLNVLPPDQVGPAPSEPV